MKARPQGGRFLVTPPDPERAVSACKSLTNDVRAAWRAEGAKQAGPHGPRQRRQVVNELLLLVRWPALWRQRSAQIDDSALAVFGNQEQRQSILADYRDGTGLRRGSRGCLPGRIAVCLAEVLRQRMAGLLEDASDGLAHEPALDAQPGGWLLTEETLSFFAREEEIAARGHPLLQGGLVVLRQRS